MCNTYEHTLFTTYTMSTHSTRLMLTDSTQMSTHSPRLMITDSNQMSTHSYRLMFTNSTQSRLILLVLYLKTGGHMIT